MKRGFLLLLASLFVSTGALHGDVVLSKVYEDNKSGLIVHYPSDWQVDDWPVFAIVNFPLSQRPRMNIVPMNGGQVVFMAPPEGVATIQSWLQFDRNPHEGDRMRQIEVNTSHLGNLVATLIDFELPVIPEGRGQAYYFEANHHVFKLQLLYRGKAKAAYFESVLTAIVENLELRKEQQ